MSMNRVISAIIPLCVCAIIFICPIEAKFVSERIFIVPAGNIDKKIPEKLKEALPASMPMTIAIEIEPARDIPQSALEESRQQYRSEDILKDISEQVRLTPVNERAIVLTDSDIFTKDKEFVFGHSDARAGLAIVSLRRLADGPGAVEADDKLFRERLLKESCRQLGASWGLGDCKNRRCVMHASATAKDMDEKRDTFCYYCRTALEQVAAGGTLFGSKSAKK